MTTLIVFLLTFVASMLIVASRLRRADALHRHERAMSVLRDMTVHDPDAAKPGETERFRVRVVQGPLPPGAAARRPARRAYAGSPSRSQAAASAAREHHVARAAARADVAPDGDGAFDDAPPPPPPIRLRIDGLDDLAAVTAAGNGNGPADTRSDHADVTVAPADGVSPPATLDDPGASTGSVPPRMPVSGASPAHDGEKASSRRGAGPSSPGRAAPVPEPSRWSVSKRVRSALAGSARRTAVAAAAALAAAVTFSAAYSSGEDEDGGVGVERNAEAPAPRAAPTTEAPAPPPAAQLVDFDGRAAAYAAPRTFGLEVGALGRCWVRIESGLDGTAIFEGIIEPGETRSFQLTSPVGVRLGNAPVVGLAVDGAPLTLPPGAPSTLNLTFAPST